MMGEGRGRQTCEVAGLPVRKRRGKRGGRKVGKGRAFSATDGLVGVFRGSEGSGRGPVNTRTELWMPGSLPLTTSVFWGG